MVGYKFVWHWRHSFFLSWSSLVFGNSPSSPFFFLQPEAMRDVRLWQTLSIDRSDFLLSLLRIYLSPFTLLLG
ncbi:hypothetical protein BDV27DRAFT_139117 [Aspergillus caelatus]|uniref:Uncharacterized protein n=1 Tax=Aspergillus caelatus TaxID=61420 RepID=A0A5N6ZIV8_9EURO|nr:uncharacterized protein BDV27DRAFT_139117 [Aspergillus caelatus]KAE8357572.1 hypothetical protein BDV27DRAFT_139117 [Aspergillus caelatus]